MLVEINKGEKGTQKQGNTNTPLKRLILAFSLLFYQGQAFGGCFLRAQGI